MHTPLGTSFIPALYIDRVFSNLNRVRAITYRTTNRLIYAELDKLQDIFRIMQILISEK